MQNYCICLVYDLRWADHITGYYVRSKILKLSDERSIKLLTLLYSIKHHDCPRYFSSTFEAVSQQSVRSTRSGSSVLRIPNHSSASFDKSFTVTACRLWNSLPANIKSIQDRRRFVASLRKLLLARMTADGWLLWLVGVGMEQTVWMEYAWCFCRISSPAIYFLVIL